MFADIEIFTLPVGAVEVGTTAESNFAALVARLAARIRLARLENVRRYGIATRALLSLGLAGVGWLRHRARRLSSAEARRGGDTVAHPESEDDAATR